MTPLLLAQYDRFALVDSQPHHHPDFASIKFSVVIDHHPKVAGAPVEAEYVEIVSEYGSNSTIMTEYLYNLGLRPGKLLATALLYGIKTDTQSFEREFHDNDMKAFRYLSKFYNKPLLHKIIRSEFRLEWLKYFTQAFRKMRVTGKTITIFMGKVDSSDILVILADFFACSRAFHNHGQRNKRGQAHHCFSRRRSAPRHGQVRQAPFRRCGFGRRAQIHGPGRDSHGEAGLPARQPVRVGASAQSARYAQKEKEVENCPNGAS